MKKTKEKITKVRAPKGFNFEIKTHYSLYTTRLFKNKKVPYSVIVKLVRPDNLNEFVGYISLEYNVNGSYVTHSRLNPEYHGKGLGTRMYGRAIQWCLENGYKVRSSGSSSDMAKRVWNGKGIRKIFRLRKRESRWGNLVWHAYSK